MKKRIFYSWQSDLPNSPNRGFINSALEKAIKEINAEEDFALIPFLDRDTAGLSGSPDISTSIFKKIKKSEIFVADVSIINFGSTDSFRLTPNPNVLIELGYAIGTLGWSRIILVMNKHFGDHLTLPFDLRGRKTLTYSLDPTNSQKAGERKKVSSILRSGIKEILLASQVANIGKKVKPKASVKDTLRKEALLKFNALKNVTYIHEKNSGLISKVKEYIKLGRIDLAVMFVPEITYVQEKNSLSIYIATEGLKSGDLDTAQKAINSITYIQEKNRLSLELLKRVES